MPQQASGNVPAFLAKLWKMVDNPDTDSLICWTEEGNSFCIKNQPEFARSLLPYYYKHSNMASFVRQLNMYGFHKVMSVESGGLKGDKDEIEFAHPYFLRGQDHLLEQIKRKVSVNNRGTVNQQFIPSIKSEKVNEVLCEVGALKERQEDLDGKLDTMRSENEALWAEVLSLRQKHNQQQKIVNKLINFLVALVQPRGMKRSFSRGVPVPGLQLAIEDGGEGGPSAKQAKREQHEAGPVIQEIQEGMTGAKLSELLSNVPVGTVHEITVSNANPSTSPNPVIDHPPATPQQPQRMNVDEINQASKYRLVDPASVNSSLIQKRPTLHREISKEDFDTDISSMQKDLDNLKEMLSGQITLDTSLVSSLFSSDSDTLGSMNLFNENLLNPEEEVSTLLQPGEVKPVTYNPSFFELTDEHVDSDELITSSKPSPFEVDLNTPQIQEDSQDPMKKFFIKK